MEFVFNQCEMIDIHELKPVTLKYMYIVNRKIFFIKKTTMFINGIKYRFEYMCWCTLYHLIVSFVA